MSKEMKNKGNIFRKATFMLLMILILIPVTSASNFPKVRVEESKRNFSSPPIEKVISHMQKTIKDPELAWMFGNCFPNTLDRTVTFSMKDGKPSTFVITGDIYAMWLRDCSAQVWPYMPYMKQDFKLQQLIAGVIHRQAESVLIDPYANAFNFGKEGGDFMSDNTTMRPELHERKWEVDGLCYVIRLGYHYWKLTGDNTCFDNQWFDAMKLIVKTFKEQQRKNGQGPYSFMRRTEKASDTQFGNGFGNPIRPTGMICSAFRPSDDATTYGFLIPSNAFAVVTLRQLAEMSLTLKQNPVFAAECTSLAEEVDAAIHKYAIVNHPKYGKIFAFEVDGYGNYLMMDDSNVPSLLSLPYLGYVPQDNEIYQNTRKFALSEDNPYFYKGKTAEGIGGPHVGQDMIWPMAIIMRAMTTNEPKEIESCLRMLKYTHAGTGFMHETFNKDNPAVFSRSWFAWANTLFGELLLKIEKEHPELLDKTY